MFSSQLRKYRQLSGLSQKELAAKLYVSQQAIARWETDHATPNPEAITKIANILGISTDALLDNEHKLIQDKYSAIFRHNLSIAINMLDSSDFSGAPEVEYDYYHLEQLTESTYPLSLAEAFDAADMLGESLDDLLREDYEEFIQNKKPASSSGDGPQDEQEQQIMDLVGQMNSVQKDFLLVLLRTVIEQNQGTLVSAPASTGEAVPRSEDRGQA